ncbi:MAG TPA: hypothetical protein VGG29_18615 [Caulobacteraceae bacterium]|jgi:hypothetical protein
MFADPLTDRIAAFIAGIGLAIQPATLDEPTLLPGVTVRGGVILVDEARLAYPGDLLHEAGHLAVWEPDRRATLDEVDDDGSREMTVIAWSYAALRHLDLDPAVVFHEGGYRGASPTLIAVFEGDGLCGQPMLEWYGLTLTRKTAAARGQPPFPHMLRWLR